MRFFVVSVLIVSALLGVHSLHLGTALGRRLVLWRVVQTCVLHHQISGGVFPCLAVETPQGTERGYAVLRSPLDDVKVIVAPTVRTVGIEAARLRGADAPNYFQDAWASRRYATATLASQPPDDDIALAVNSKAGRSQDQLHIHVACVQPDIKRALTRNGEAIRETSWTRLKLGPGVPHYWARFVPGRDLSQINVFDLVDQGLHNASADMAQTTIVVVGKAATRTDPAGFTILARRRVPHSRDEAHGEFLLDQNCDEPPQP